MGCPLLYDFHDPLEWQTKKPLHPSLGLFNILIGRVHMALTKDEIGLLALEDGSLFYGQTRGCCGTACGEVVFNSSMTGYQEICTDLSYSDQIVLFTSTHIGNVGVNCDDFESDRITVNGLLVREMSKTSSSWRSEKSFTTFLEEQGVPWIEGLDTRKLARHIRQKGSMRGCMMTGNIDEKLAVQLAAAWRPTKELSYSAAHSFRGGPKIVVYDFGVKAGIVKKLKGLGCEVIVVPGTTPSAEALAIHPDAIVLSNGPGDPTSIDLEKIKKLVFSEKAILGICLGCQLIALACGGSIKRLKFGHHSANHPVYDRKNNRVFITSQNHGYAIDEVPPGFEVTHHSLFDGTIQGIKHNRVVGFQGHPEGSPGPEYLELFEELIQLCR